MTSATPHPDSEMLLRLIDDDVSAAEASELERHMAECEDCQEQCRMLRETLGDYIRFHTTVLKPSLPPVPRSWDQLEWLSPVQGAKRVLPFRPRFWLAVAAAIALAFVLIRRFEHTPPVSAAELLSKAVAAEGSRVPSLTRIRIRTRKARWDRPARQAPTPRGEAAEVQRLLQSVGYPADDPLSAAAFTQWRGTVTGTHDEVSSLPVNGPAESYVVRTSADGGAVSDASLTLRARDLQALACTLHLRSDATIEMTQLADDPIAPSPQVPVAEPAEPRPDTGVARAAGPGEELQVVAALHRIAADLGEPIEVKRDGGAVRVNINGVDSHRQEQVRTALAGIAGVEVQAGGAAPHDQHEGLAPGRSTPQADSPSPLIAELQAGLGNDISPSELANRLIDGTDSSIERAYALRSLARRFPSETAAQLSPAERTLLNNIVRDHLDNLSRSIDAMRKVLAPVLPGAGETPLNSATSAVDWQAPAEAILVSVQQVDHELNASADGNGDVAGRKARLVRALNELAKQIVTLRRLVL